MNLFKYYFRFHNNNHNDNHNSADQLDDSTKYTFLAYFLWFGSHKAIQSGFWDISCGMLR